MPSKPKILAFAGSLRQHSLNARALRNSIRGAHRAGAEVTLINLRDYPMRVYNLDEHENNGFDENALKLQALFIQHDGLLIASPEYNGSLPAALKNAIDWVSRPNLTYDRTKVFTGKIAAIISASPGPFGGVRALNHLRGVLTSVNVLVLPQEVAVTFAEDKFVEDSEEMSDEATQQRLEDLGAMLVQTLEKNLSLKRQ